MPYKLYKACITLKFKTNFSKKSLVHLYKKTTWFEYLLMGLFLVTMGASRNQEERLPVID